MDHPGRALPNDAKIRDSLIEVRRHILNGNMQQADLTLLAMDFGRVLRASLQYSAPAFLNRNRIRETADYIDDCWGSVHGGEVELARSAVERASSAGTIMQTSWYVLRDH